MKDIIDTRAQFDIRFCRRVYWKLFPCLKLSALFAEDKLPHKAFAVQNCRNRSLGNKTEHTIAEIVFEIDTRVFIMNEFPAVHHVEGILIVIIQFIPRRNVQ